MLSVHLCFTKKKKNRIETKQMAFQISICLEMSVDMIFMTKLARWNGEVRKKPSAFAMESNLTACAMEGDLSNRDHWMSVFFAICLSLAKTEHDWCVVCPLCPRRVVVVTDRNDLGARMRSRWLLSSDFIFKILRGFFFSFPFNLSVYFSLSLNTFYFSACDLRPTTCDKRLQSIKHLGCCRHSGQTVQVNWQLSLTACLAHDLLLSGLGTTTAMRSHKVQTRRFFSRHVSRWHDFQLHKQEASWLVHWPQPLVSGMTAKVPPTSDVVRPVHKQLGLNSGQNKRQNRLKWDWLKRIAASDGRRQSLLFHTHA